METLGALYRRMKSVLKQAGADNPALNARLLIGHGGGFSNAELITLTDTPLSQELIEKIEKIVSRRAAGEPVSRIIGSREFWGMDFLLSPDTLDPRADTETLVAAALTTARCLTEVSETEGVAPLRLLDLGTGSGCILIALLSELRSATGTGVDLSEGALRMARANAERHGVGDRAAFLQGSWFSTLADGQVFDIIVSNPPYIPESHLAGLSVDVRDHDPILALTGGADGLDCYRDILFHVKKYLALEGALLLEIGQGQGPDIARLAANQGLYVCESRNDLAGIERVLKIVRGEN